MRARDLPYFDAPFAALAHRGGYGGTVPPALENSLVAFRNAVSLGFRYLETDVHATADGVLVAFHDADLDRVTDAAGAIERRTWAELREVRIGGSEPIPTLASLLEELPDARLNIDLKSDAAVVPLLHAIEAHRAHALVCVGSFDASRIRRFRRLAGPRVATSVSPAGVAAYATGRGVRGLIPPRGLAFQVPIRDPRSRLPIVTRGFVSAAHRAGRVVHVWTINDADEMHRLIDLGVDGLVSDDLDTLKAVLRQRGLWEETR